MNMQKSTEITELAKALAAAQMQMKNPAFDKQNPHFKSKFASLAAVRDAVVPVFAKHGLSVVQSLFHADTGMGCETMILHSSGQWISGHLVMPASKADAQGYGSAATYARRYALMAFAGVVGDDDDDGNEASKPKNGAAASPLQANGRAKDRDPADILLTLDIERQKEIEYKAGLITDAVNGNLIEDAYDCAEEVKKELDKDEFAALWGKLPSGVKSILKREAERRKQQSLRAMAGTQA